MNAFAMEAGPAHFGGDFVESVRRFLYRLAAAIAIVLLLALLFVLFVPLAIVGVIYLVVRSALGSLGAPARAPQGEAEPVHAPIPESDNEGRENVRVRMPGEE